MSGNPWVASNPRLARHPSVVAAVLPNLAQGRRIAHRPRMAPTETCVVCGMSDTRALSTTKLAGGETATVCGSHALIHERAQARARTVHELRRIARERRTRSRRDGASDELGALLAAAFAGERRGREERRRPRS